MAVGILLTTGMIWGIVNSRQKAENGNGNAESSSNGTKETVYYSLEYQGQFKSNWATYCKLTME